MPIPERAEVIGKAITRLLRTEPKLVEGQPCPGVSSGDQTFFEMAVELESGILLTLGETGATFHWISDEAATAERMTPFDLPDGQTCVGDAIEDVLMAVSFNQVYLRLASGRYLWAADDMDGTEIGLDESLPPYLDADDLTPYWDDAESV